jgi:hypothetical protein
VRLGLLALGLLAAGRELDVELRFGLSPLGFALFQDALCLAAHLVGLALGGGEDLVPLALGRGLHLRDLTLGRGTQLGDLPLDGGALLGDLVVHHRPQLGDLALGRRRQLVGLAPRGGADAVRLALGRAAQVVGLTLGVGAELGGLVLGACPQFGGVDLGRSQHLAGFGPRFLEDLVALLFGEPQQLLNPGAEARVGGALLLLHLAMRVGKLLLERLLVLAERAKLAVLLLEVRLDLFLVVSAHFLGKPRRLVVVEERTELGIDIGLHVA